MREDGQAFLTAAHPRSRGEHCLNRLYSFLFFGSPPLARGTLTDSPIAKFGARLTPARAGNTHGSSGQSQRWSAHPRSRGEHYDVATGVLREFGSPPLARGTQEAGRVPRLHARLTPARAGNTSGVITSPVMISAHPRSRGEHIPARVQALPRYGSPPLARGTHSTYGLFQVARRLTPARAGNTTTVEKIIKYRTAHPRSRGEHFAGPVPRRFPCGSPPLARGTPGRWYDQLGRLRLTPARAGNTKPTQPPPPPSPAHPRSRGEHRLRYSWSLYFVGSPPLARGTHFRVACLDARHRLTPARAGNTHQLAPTRRRGSAHPRSRGEHTC